jgi:hypothetical protein
MADDTAQPIDSAPASDQAPAPAAGAPRSASLDDLSAALAEFDAAVKPEAVPTPAPPVEPSPDLQRIQREHEETGKKLQEVSSTLERMDHDRRLEQEQAQNRADFDLIVKHTHDEIADLRYMPEGFAAKWWTNEILTNADLREKLTLRHRDQASKAAAERAVERAVSSLRREVEQRPDPRVTEDREAVTWAMRAAGKRQAPENDQDYARRLSRMSNAEFEQHRREVIGQ